MTKSSIVVVVLLCVAGLSGVATAETGAATTEPTIGVGYQAMFLGDFFQGVSLRSWLGTGWGLEANLQQASMKATVDSDGSTYKADAGLYLFSGKVMYAPIIKEHSKFYLGVELGYGQLDFELRGLGSSLSGKDRADVWAGGPLFGAEYRFQELPELGFNWEVGYRMGDISSKSHDRDIDLDLRGITVCLGVHYYFN